VTLQDGTPFSGTRPGNEELPFPQLRTSVSLFPPPKSIPLQRRGRVNSQDRSARRQTFLSPVFCFPFFFLSPPVFLLFPEMLDQIRCRSFFPEPRQQVSEDRSTTAFLSPPSVLCPSAGGDDFSFFFPLLSSIAARRSPSFLASKECRSGRTTSFCFFASLLFLHRQKPRLCRHGRVLFFFLRPSEGRSPPFSLFPFNFSSLEKI